MLQILLQLLRCLRSVRKPNGVRAPINKAFNFDYYRNTRRTHKANTKAKKRHQLTM